MQRKGATLTHGFSRKVMLLLNLIKPSALRTHLTADAKLHACHKNYDIVGLLEQGGREKPLLKQMLILQRRCWVAKLLGMRLLNSSCVSYAYLLQDASFQILVPVQ